MTYWELILEMINQLKKANQNEEVAFFILYNFTSIKNKLEFISQKEKYCDQYKICLTALNEYLNNKPLSKIIHKETFYKLKFQVFDNVFSPRSETELLVDKTLEFIKNRKNLKIADVCSGTGVIGLSIAKFSDVSNEFYLIDINEDAITNIQTNKNNLKLENNIKIYQSDLFNQLITNKIKIDVLVSNPPYISKEYKLAKGVEDFDPTLALYADNNGLAVYEELLINFRKVVNDWNKYLILFEIGYDQAEKIRNLVLSYLNVTEEQITILKDYNQLDRVLIVNQNFNNEF